MSTLPKLLIDQATSTPNKVAWRQFRLGVWNEHSWSAVHVEAAAIGTGLATLGLGVGDVVAVLADNSVTAIASELGAMGIGCTVAVLSSDLAPSTVKNILELTEAKVAIVGNQEQFDKVVATASSTLRTTVVIDARGFRHIESEGRPDADQVLTMDQLKKRSASTGDWDSRVASVESSGPAAILCVVDRPNRQVEVHRFSHDALVQHVGALTSSSDASGADIVAVQASIADPIEHTLSVTGPLVLGTQVNIGQADLATQSMRQVQPTLVAFNREWLTVTAGAFDRRIAAGRGLKGFAARRGLTRRDLLTVAVGRHKFPPTKLAGMVAAVVGFVFLLFSTGLNDFLRILIVVCIALAVGLFTLFSGLSAVGSAKRGLGLVRTRAVVHDGSLSDDAMSAAAALLGTLGVPAVVLSSSPGELLGRVHSEVLA